MTAPRLEDPEQLAAYRDELRQVARGTRGAGLALAVLGFIFAVVRATIWPWIPELIPVAIIATALGLILIGIIRRVRYHMKRFRDL